LNRFERCHEHGAALHRFRTAALRETVTYLLRCGTATLESMKTFTLPVLALLLTACATPDAARQSDSPAAATPLHDLNIVRAEIPPVLIAAQKAPYALPADRTCPSLASEVQALDVALGPDLDTPATAANPGLVERGAAAAGNAAVGALRGAAEGVIPYRGWVRKLTGAERYSKDVSAAIAAGTIRRAFLKGLAQAIGCQGPGAPRAS
jgi:hypothetical protein